MNEIPVISLALFLVLFIVRQITHTRMEKSSARLISALERQVAALERQVAALDGLSETRKITADRWKEVAETRERELQTIKKHIGWEPT